MLDLDGSRLPHRADDRVASVSQREVSQRQHPRTEEPMGDVVYFMGEPDLEEATTMTCRINGCPGTYEPKRRVRTIHRTGELLVIRNVPMEECDVCGNAFFHEETVHQSAHHRR
jgi:YgiT-type zinc finger domain-containing protein